MCCGPRVTAIAAGAATGRAETGIDRRHPGRRERLTEPDHAHQILLGVDQVHDTDRSVHHDRDQLRQPVQCLPVGLRYRQHSGHRR